MQATIASLCIVAVSVLCWLLRQRKSKPRSIDWSCPPEASPAWHGTALSNFETPTGRVLAYDPSTAYDLGSFPSLSSAEVESAIQKAHQASLSFNESAMETRLLILDTLLRFVLENMTAIAQICARDTGKTSTTPCELRVQELMSNTTVIDAGLGEVLTTLEKLRWTIANGPKALKDEARL